MKGGQNSAHMLHGRECRQRKLQNSRDTSRVQQISLLHHVCYQRLQIYPYSHNSPVTIAVIKFYLDRLLFPNGNSASCFAGTRTMHIIALPCASFLICFDHQGAFVCFCSLSDLMKVLLVFSTVNQLLNRQRNVRSEWRGDARRTYFGEEWGHLSDSSMDLLRTRNKAKKGTN